jgi:cyanophycinase
MPAIRSYLRIAVCVAVGSLLWNPAARADDEIGEITAGNRSSGSLVICGGGKLSEAIFGRFTELAGGEKAHVVIVTTAQDKADSLERAVFEKRWMRRKAASAVVLHTDDRKEAESDAFVAPLRRATAVWFEGGQQHRLASAYLGTKTEQEFNNVLKRGGVIGGTSAGAAIQSRTMISGGNPVPTMATGLDLLHGAIIDQHFTQRKRQPRLLAALEHNAELLGVGIDESTALVVRDGIGEVLGENAVHFFDPKRSDAGGKTTETALKSGEKYDFSLRAKTGD